MSIISSAQWAKQVIKQSEIDKYLIKGNDFINDREISDKLSFNQKPDKERIRDVIRKSLSIQ